MKYVYVLKAVDCYKVGVALSVKRRVAELQTSNANRINIVSVKLVENPYEVERKLHKYLEKYQSEGGGREWFKLTPSRVIRLLIMLNQEAEIRGLAEELNVKQILQKNIAGFDEMFENMRNIKEYLRQEFEENLALQLERDRIREKREQAERKIMPRIPAVNTDEELLKKCIPIIRKEKRASTSLLQRRLRIGYSKASRIMELLEDGGYVAPADGMRAREVYPEEDFDLRLLTKS